VVEKKEAKITSLQHDLSQHQQALDDNESFLAQLNTQVKQLSSELTDAKTKQEQEDEHMKDVRLETALTRKISKLREQLLARDELMKELVQSLEETREQVSSPLFQFFVAHSLPRLFVCSFIYSFIHSFICSFIHLVI